MDSSRSIDLRVTSVAFDLLKSPINTMTCLTAPRSDAEKYVILPKISIQCGLSARRINLKI